SAVGREGQGGDLLGARLQGRVDVARFHFPEEEEPAQRDRDGGAVRAQRHRGRFAGAVGRELLLERLRAGGLVEPYAVLIGDGAQRGGPREGDVRTADRQRRVEA